MSKALVLGANGFIGSHLVDSLASRGHEVRAYGHFSSNEPRFDKSDNVEIFAGDYMNTSQLAEALQGIDYVFHFLSSTTPATAENDPVLDIDTNIRASVELFKLCVESNVKRVLFASSGGTIYGEGEGTGPNGAHLETDPTLPVSPYGIGKLAIENYLRYFRTKHGLESTTFRISNPYGERQPFMRKQGVIPIFLEKIYREEPITVLGDGSMVRDYIYVKDVAEMIASVFDKETLQEVYNLGSGEGASLNEIIEIAQQVVGKEALVERRPSPATFVHDVVLDVSRFTDDFQLPAHTNLVAGMKSTYQHIKSEVDEMEK